MKQHRQLLYSILIIAVTVIVLVAGEAYFTLRMSQSGIIVAVGIEAYSDAKLTHKATEVSWGLVPLGSTTERALYIKNNGTMPITLTFQVAEWNPTEAAQFISLSWNCTNTALQSSEVVLLKLCFTHYGSASSSFGS